MINKEKFKKLVDLAYELEKLGADVFLDYSGHVKTIEVRLFLNGWEAYADPDYSNECYLDGGEWVFGKDNIDDCIKSLTRMLDEKKESLSV